MSIFPASSKTSGVGTALVLGATGGIGGQVARQLRDAGWTVRALQRRLDQPQLWCDGMTWIRGDALDASQVSAAARGCDVLVHAVNPPGYQNWDTQVLPMLDHTIAAASSSSATVLLPGTVYNYGPDAWADLHEQAPQNPLTRKGAIRVEMERRLAEAAGQGGLRAIVLRAGDFFGPGAANNWFSQGLVRPGRPVTRIVDPGARGIGHQWAYLPDVAAAMVRLLERRHLLPAMARFHMDGHWDPNGSQMVQTIRDVVQRRAGNLPRVWRFPWGLASLASPWVPFLREVQEMRYLWERPVRLRGELLAELLGQDLPHTPWEDAVERTLESMGCLAPAATRGMSEPRTHAPSGAALPASPVTPPARHATGAPAR